METNIKTSSHDVLPEDRYPEQPGQDGQVGFHPRKCVREATTLRAEAGEGSGTHDAVRVTTQNVVLLWTQLGGFHQLSTTREGCV